jgi:hypothetical protein
MGKQVTYTVRATQRKDERYSDGTMAQEKGTTIYLGYSSEGGGWPQWGTSQPTATPYKSASEALRVARSMDGMPWWNRPDMRTLIAIRLTNLSEHIAEDVAPDAAETQAE